MLTVTRFDLSDVFHTSLYAGTLVLPCVCLSRKRDSERIGIEPSTYGGNLVGDHACIHRNMNGHIFTMPPEITRSSRVVATYYDTISRTQQVSLEQDVYMMKGRGWTHFIYPGQNIPFRLMYTSYNYVTYVGTLKKMWSGGARWKDSRTLYVDYFMEQWMGDSSFMRYSWTMYIRQYNSSMTQFRTASITVQNEQITGYDRSLFYPDTMLAWSAWSKIISSSTYTLSQSNQYVDRDLTAEKLWQRSELFSNGLVHSPNKLIWEKLAMSAIDGTKTLDINTPMYLADFFRLKDTILSYNSLFESISKKKIPSWESIRKSFLATHYGLKLTFLDTQEILKNFNRQVPTLLNGTVYMCHSRDRDNEQVFGRGLGNRSTVVERSYNLKIYYRPVDEVILENIRQMFVWDVFPSLENAWDLIPFSFVADWFLDVGSFLKTYDYHTYISTLKILSTIQTRRTSFTIPASALIAPTGQGYVGGEVQFVNYDRKLVSSLPYPVSRLGLSNPLDHWVEGGFLFIRGR